MLLLFSIISFLFLLLLLLLSFVLIFSDSDATAGTSVTDLVNPYAVMKFTGASGAVTDTAITLAGVGDALRLHIYLPSEFTGTFHS